MSRLGWFGSHAGCYVIGLGLCVPVCFHSRILYSGYRKLRHVATPLPNRLVKFDETLVPRTHYTRTRKKLVNGDQDRLMCKAQSGSPKAGASPIMYFLLRRMFPLFSCIFLLRFRRVALLRLCSSCFMFVCIALCPPGLHCLASSYLLYR